MAITTTAVDVTKRTSGAGTSVSITGVQLGTAFADRVIVIALGTAGGANITAATIGGITANIYNGVLFLISAVVPTGTSATVALTLNVSDTVESFTVWSLANALNATMADQEQATTGSITVSIPAGGCAVAFIYSPTDGSWSNATQDYEDAGVLSTAHYDNPGGLTNRTINYTPHDLIVGASFTAAAASYTPYNPWPQAAPVMAQ